MIEPINGKIERSTQKTEVRFAYDDFTIYIGATLNDKNAGYDDPNIVGIMKELGPRDQEGKIKRERACVKSKADLGLELCCTELLDAKPRNRCIWEYMKTY